MTTITLPYAAVSRDQGIRLMRLPGDEYEAAQQRLVDAALQSYDLEPVPEAWDGSPMRRWCWHLLQINGLDPDPETPQPLTHFGIDLGFTSTEIRNFLFAIA